MDKRDARSRLTSLAHYLQPIVPTVEAFSDAWRGLCRATEAFHLLRPKQAGCSITLPYGLDRALCGSLSMHLLGRNYNDVSDAIREFMRRGVIIRTVINNMTFDGATTDPIQMAVRDALIGFMAATAQAQAEAIKVAQRSGIDLVKASKEDRKYLGRKPSFTRAQFEAVCSMLDMSSGVSEIAAATGLTRQTIYRIRDDRAGAEAALENWATKRRAA